MQQYSQFLTRTLLIFTAALLAAVCARPPQLGETNQLINDQDSNLLDSGLKPWQLEMLLAQRLAEMNQAGGPGEFGFERALRSATERKRRYRACYFNPVSCFK